MRKHSHYTVSNLVTITFCGIKVLFSCQSAHCLYNILVPSKPIVVFDAMFSFLLQKVNAGLRYRYGNICCMATPELNCTIKKASD